MDCCASISKCRMNNKENNEHIKTTSETSSVLSTLLSTAEDALSATKLNISLTNRGFQIYGTWSGTDLLKLLTDRLKECVRVDSGSPKEGPSDTIRDRRLWTTIHSGLYSTHILKTVQKKGMSAHTVIKAMKLGLISLSYCELLYFEDFNVDPYTLEFKDMWSNKFSEDLISNLRTTGLNETECWHIIVYGVRLQSSRALCRLMLSGIDVPGILKWQSPINSASSKIIKFLRHIGMEEDVIQLVEQYGIDDETEQMLVDLGLNEVKRKSEEIICECSVATLEPNTNSLDIMQDICRTSNSKSTSTLVNTSDYFQLCSCQCHFQREKQTTDELTAQRNDYLRQNVMVPLAWAMGRALRYKPSDPIHYVTYQLLRWKHSNVIQTEKDEAREFVALATIAMDQRLIAKKLLEEEELIRSLNEETMKNIPCDFCKHYQESRRIKDSCWKCIKRPAKEYAICEYPEMCSSCKLTVLNTDEHLERAGQE